MIHCPPAYSTKQAFSLLTLSRSRAFQGPEPTTGQPNDRFVRTETPKTARSALRFGEGLRPVHVRFPVQSGLRSAISGPRENSFCIVGDFGYLNDNGPPERNDVYTIGRTMADTHAAAPYGAVFLTGDNIYPDGDIVGLGEKAFHKPFARLANSENAPALYLSLGNHDVNSELEAFIDPPGCNPLLEARKLTVGGILPGEHPADHDIYRHWGKDQLQYPAFSRSERLLPVESGQFVQRRYYKAPLIQGKVDVFVLDTNDFVGYHGAEYPICKRQVLRAWRQLQWLNRELAQSEATWKIVIGHHPPYRGHPTLQRGPVLMRSRMVADLLPPLFKHYGVTYLCGHTHGYLNYDVDTRHTAMDRKFDIDPDGYFKTILTGGGGAPIHPQDFTTAADQVLKRIPAHHFLKMVLCEDLGMPGLPASEDALQFRTIGADGQILDGGSLPVSRHPDRPAKIPSLQDLLRDYVTEAPAQPDTKSIKTA